MTSWLSRWRVSMVGLIAVFLLACMLRLYQYWDFPVAGETQDEMAWSFLGASLLQTGRPVSWSYFSGYEVLEVARDGEAGAEFRLVAPALDHPPLFSFIPGGALTILQKQWSVLPSIKVVRFPVIILGCINVAMFLWWIRRSSLLPSGQMTAAVLFATIPSFVWLSRLVVSENLLVFELLALLVLSTWKRAPRWLWGILLASLPLTKMSGLAIGGALVAWGWTQRQEHPRRFFWMVAGLAGGMMLWLLYAALFDLSLFWQIQLQQSQRDTGFLTLFTAQFWAPTLVEKVSADPWITLGWVAGFMWLAQRWFQKQWSSEQRLVALLFLAQCAFIAGSVGEHTVHGWYRIVFFPLFAYFYGAIFQEIMERRSWLGLAAISFVLGPVWRMSLFSLIGSTIFEWQNMLSRLSLGISGLFVGADVFPLPARFTKQIFPFIVVIGMLLVILAQSITVLTWTQEKYWQDELYLEQGLRT